MGVAEALLAALFMVITWGAIIAAGVLIISTAIVVRRNTRQQTELQQEMRSLLGEIKGLLQNVTDGAEEGEETDDVV